MVKSKKNQSEKVTVEKEVTLTEEVTESAVPPKKRAAQFAGGEFADLTAEEIEQSIICDPTLMDEDCRVVYIESAYPYGSDIEEGEEIDLEAKCRLSDHRDLLNVFDLRWYASEGYFKDESETGERLSRTFENSATVRFVALAIKDRAIDITLTARLKCNPELRFTCTLRLNRKADLGDIDEELHNLNRNIRNTPNFNGVVPVSLQRTSITPTGDIGLWLVIRKSTQATSFGNYARFMEMVLCGRDGEGRQVFPPTDEIDDQANEVYRTLRKIRSLPFNDTDAYRLLKTATEAFLLVNGGVALTAFPFDSDDIDDLIVRMGANPQFTTDGLNSLWAKYIGVVNGSCDPLIPYLELIRQKFRGEPLKTQIFRKEPSLEGGLTRELEYCMGVLGNKLTRPFLVELIWSYWHEEGMLVQSMNAIARRFQNVRSPNGGRDPLANLEIDPLRALNNLLWGYVQDEQHRLSLVRRVYEYDHHYGIALQGRAVPRLRPADSRSKFLEAFHHLLHLASVFYKQDDDTTVNSDGFPLQNALREVHLILSQGAHNQFGDLPSTARQEMLVQQWLLARPEFREFLPTRNMVAYPEPWMDRVDAMKSLQGWTDISIDHFNRLAVFGEQILLSVRFGAWSAINQSSSAANWARFWRAEIQGYIHDYRAVTGVDLASSARVDSTPPSVHLFNRYMAQARR